MIFEKIRDIIAEQFSIQDRETITLDTDFVNDLGADSLDIVEFIMAIEEEFDIDVPDDDVKDVKTVKDIVDYIASK